MGRALCKAVLEIMRARLEAEKGGVKLCQGYVVLCKEEDGKQSHLQLNDFIKAADKDNAWYLGLANALIIQHFAVNDDAAMAQDGRGYCETFKRLFNVLEVFWATTGKRNRCAIIVADPTLHIAEPTALRHVKNDPQWKAGLIEGGRELFKLHTDNTLLNNKPSMASCPKPSSTRGAPTVCSKSS
jgi:hypothetical protein